MPLLMLKDLPRYNCLLECSKRFPDLNPEAASLFMQLLRTADALYEVKADFLRKHNISNGRFTVLMLLTAAGSMDGHAEKNPPKSPADLAEMAGVTRATMTGLIDTLEKDGMVRRESDPRDRRAMLVHLTPKGERFTAEILPGYFRQVTAIMGSLPPGEKMQLTTILAHVRAGIENASEVAVPLVSPV
ncbi:MAG: MarR family winged helix-turn-helix transcriptional regulator [Verrucomicrobiia bacterium]|tara:strand:- start:20474 stop:21037 length:564 start_codon:yes stop_codon:yes gene_type:complete